jgi:hypothetical protein
MVELKDPVSKGDEGEDTEGLEKTMDIASLKMSDFKSVVLTDERTAHPFSGYPKNPIQIGEFELKKKMVPLIVDRAHVVAYTGRPPQDPSGKGVVLGYPELRDNEGRVKRNSTEKMGNIINPHNVWVHDFEDGGRTVECVFDREITIADGTLRQCCIISSPSARAQIIFKFDSHLNRIVAQKDYFLADPGQIKLLKRLFFQYIVKPHRDNEDAIKRVFDSEGTSAGMVDLSGIPEG